ncbi:aggregation promoting factor [Ligilactobacillus hayakitensis DSM 18933 = JCM 14209]|uniref:Aggregation promoting factor n=1 Tax=Ligilactobacillus hayakitensis DSM 18933 = JCM 14209 TaxID=1423755 RepID=A0A0R1WPY4_9LACO|nr:LysM domain-containing protein [Ligilactobacillus hayakitensis]KRM19485.1 aggregation promoting factor [Ligilactobacillus hayakitensis DSM 18933 = JCM 14209]
MKFKKALATVGAAAGFLTAGAVAANADQVTVQAGDTVSKIALEHNTTVEQIRVLNNLADVNLIYVGQILEVGENGQTQTQNQAQTQVAPAAQSASQAVASYNAGYQNVTANNSYNNNTNNNYSYNAGTTTSTQSVAANNNYQAASLGGSEDEARAWIANKESGGSYTARNGQYIGKYQLSSSYLNGDYSAANQERVAQQYVQQRYGSWQGAKSFWQSHGWY